jgi:hypothetical protein
LVITIEKKSAPSPRKREQVNELRERKREREREKAVSLSHFPASSFSFRPFSNTVRKVCGKIVPSVRIEPLKLK